jgi:hypothetical protein
LILLRFVSRGNAKDNPAQSALSTL